jgi:hypothetical protein
MDIVVQIFKTVGSIHSRRFWLLWFTVFTTSLIYVRSMARHVAAPGNLKTKRSTINVVWTRTDIWNRESAIALTSLLSFLAGYIAIILVWENFCYYDNDFLTLYLLKGRDFPPPIWQDNGRFVPLGFIEFNLVRHFTNTPYGYQLIPILQLLILVVILLVLDSDLTIVCRAGLAILALLTPSIFLSFGGIIYLERNVLFLLACLILSVKKFETSKSVGWAVASVVCAQTMIYFKEVGFLLLLGFAAGRLLLRCTNGQSARLDYKRLWDSESRLDLCLAALAALFLPSYFLAMGLHGNINYASAARHPLEDVLRYYLELDLLLWLFVAVVIGRMYLIARGRTSPWVLWDGLALGGVAYLLAYISLGMVTAYYMAPVDLIAVLYLGRIVLLSWKSEQSWSRVAVLCLAGAVLIQDLSLSAFAAFERKNLIHADAEIASVVEARYRNGAGRVPRLFFPFATPYSIMEFVVYLNYKGVPIGGASLEQRGIPKDGRCIEYRSVKCHPASAPIPGDLVIVLPDDGASLAEALVYRKQEELLFSYEPSPPLPHWLYPMVGDFPLASGFYNKTRPDRWMDASVTLWH